MQNLVTSKSHLDGCDEENIEKSSDTNIKFQIGGRAQRSYKWSRQIPTRIKVMMLMM